ncbi:MAG TPA: hypothetical protein VLA94_03445, partial [Syntrophales bacterium]|nr:hypothetical protein [Syntrophales bacterium]
RLFPLHGTYAVHEEKEQDPDQRKQEEPEENGMPFVHCSISLCPSRQDVFSDLWLVACEMKEGFASQMTRFLFVH